MSNKRIESWSALIIGILCLVLVWISPMVSAIADEAEMNATTISNLMVATEDITVRTEKNNKANELVTYHEGDTVFVTGQTEDGWYIVNYQGQVGYFMGKGKGAPLKENDKVTDLATLNQEMEQQAVESLFFGEEVIQCHESRKNAIIWAVVIGGAILGIFLTAFFSAKKKDKDETEENQVDEGLEETPSVEQKEMDAEVMDEMSELDKDQEIQGAIETDMPVEDPKEENIKEVEETENIQERDALVEESQEVMENLQGVEDDWNKLINQIDDIEFIDLDDVPDVD